MSAIAAAVVIVGAPVACAEGTQDTWRDLAQWAATRLQTRYGDQVMVSYFGLFEPSCPALPAAAQLPVVLVNGQVVISGGKLSLPAIRAHLEAMGLRPT